MIELLLPAGNWDCLKAAVENGADAVYFGVDRFNARRRANNFKLDEIKKVVDYCHSNGVRVYCTLNTLVKNEEVNDFFEIVKKVYLAGVDAVIIQHISFLSIIKQNFKGLDVHLSTQSTITNSYFYDLIKDADRIILPRECSKEDIKIFVPKLNVEVFVQGALCFSYSGKCLFSSVIGGRSGNRGLCAQPCRRRYNNEYLLSMKDLCLINKIPELISLGVSALKVEGRLRSVKYVEAATKVYRNAIDSYYKERFNVDLKLLKELELAFNREFTSGYYLGCKDLVSSERSMGRGLFLGVIGKGNMIKLEEDVCLGDGVGIWFKDKVDGAILRKMKKNGKEISSAKKGDVVRLFIRANEGTKIYKTSSVKPAIKISFEKRKPIIIKKRSIDSVVLPIISHKKSVSELLVKVYSLDDARLALKNGANKVFYNIFASDFDSNFGAYVPRILNDKDVETVVNLILKLKVKSVLIGDLGVYALLRNKGLDLYLDYSCNIFNDYDLEFFSAVAVVSPELSFNDLKIFNDKSFAVFVHGRIVLMNTKYSNLPLTLKDEKGFVFNVRKEHDYYQILNCVELGLFNDVLKLDVKRLFLDLDSDVEYLVKLYKGLLNGYKVKVNTQKYTKGHFERGVA